MFFEQYDTDHFFDEMFDADGKVRPHYQAILERLTPLSIDKFEQKRQAVEMILSQSSHQPTSLI